MKATQHLKKLNIMKPVTHFLLALLLCFLFTRPIYAQKSISLIAGAGLPELIHVGARYQVEQSQVGASIGFASQALTSYNADFLFHFGKASTLSSRKPWYVKWNYTYLKEKNEYEKINTSLFGGRIGREFNITQTFGIALDGGFIFRLDEDTTQLKPRPSSGWKLDLDLGILNILLPAVGINTFYKF